MSDVAAIQPPHGRALAALQKYTPGVLVSVIIAIAATFLSDHYGGPVMLFALLLGMAFYFLSQEGRCVAGIELASKRILRVAVGLLGAQITIGQIMHLGITPVVMVVVAVLLTIGFGVVGGTGLRPQPAVRPAHRRCRGDLRGFGGAGHLVGAAQGRKPRARHGLTVIGVTTLSTMAMIIYPVVIAFFHLDHAAIGIFLGGTIHDVAQVVGAGFSVSQETGTVATFTKLLRVAMLVPVVMSLTFIFRAHNVSAAGRRLPGFLVVFVLLVLINSTGVIPPVVLDVLKSVSRWCLVTAIAALGMKTSLKAMAAVGWKAIALIVSETVFLAVLVLAVVVWRF